MSEACITSARIPLGSSNNGNEVWYDRDDFHAATHVQDTPELAQLAAEVTGDTELSGDYLQFHKDMGRIVDKTDLVPVKPGDEVRYAKRLNRNEFTAFNMSQSAQPCSLITVAYRKHADDSYELVSTWIGPSDSPSFPGTERETPDSKTFWSSHALAWGNQKIQPETLTDICP